ncbi:hypothetical protein L596_022177 [Steinernema carpocapsae]|nr:hypothetical protein L596_022177 [Steinernema carpocapsae]
MDFLPWKYEIKDKDTRATYTIDEMMAFDPNYLSIHEIEITMDEYLEHELTQEKALGRFLPFLCEHIDDKDNRLHLDARIPDEALQILQNESKIKFFVLYGHKDIYKDFLEHKLDTITPLKLVLYRWWEEELVDKIEEKFLAGELTYYIASETNLFIDIQMAVNIINYFKETRGKKEFYLDATKKFNYKQLEPYVHGLEYKFLKDEGGEFTRRIYTLPGTAKKLQIIKHCVPWNSPNNISFNVSH